MGIKYIDGDIEGKLLQSLKDGEFQSESDDESIFYFNEDICFIEKELSIYGYSPSASKRRESELKNIKPILGMGLRAALKRLSGYMSPSKTLKARVDSDIASLTLLEQNLSDDKSGALLLSAAGVALMGPVGALAGLAAKKKGDVVFLIEFKPDLPETLLRGRSIVAAAPLETFETLRRVSRAVSKSSRDLFKN